MQGFVTADREAVLTITLLDASGQSTDVEAVIDTGFTDFLTLPRNVANSLLLLRKGVTQATLADGSEIDLEVFQARDLWHGQPRTIDILAAAGGPLIGMNLLYGSRLTMDILDGAIFTLELLP